MAITYSPNLKFTLIGTGDQAGTWGNTTNTNIGTLIEQSIAGYVSQTVADSAGSPTSLTIADGTDSAARNMVMVLQGALTGARDLILPTSTKLYFIHNNTSGGFAVTAKCSGQTGVSIPNGAKAILVCNGVDIVEAANYFSGLVFPSSATIATLSGTTLGYGSASITAASIASGTVTNLLATTFTGGSASITTITGTSANLVTLTANTIGSTASSTIRGSSGVITQFNATSATITTLTCTSATITNFTLPSSATITTLSGTTLGYGSASITTVTGTTIGTTGASQIRGASGSIAQFTATSMTTTTLTATSSTITTIKGTSGNITNFSATSMAVTSASITGLSVTSAAIGKFTAGSSSVDNLFASGVITVDGAAHTNPSVVTFAASSMTVNCNLSNVFTVTMTANITAAPVVSNAKDGQTINWFFTQDGTGGRTAIWPTSFKWPGGSTGVLSTTSSSVDLLVATYRSATTFWYAALTKDFR
jgi:hypothetical protein